MSTKSNKTGPKPTYPWDRWLKPGSKHTLKKGRDFRCSTHSFVTYLYMTAGRKGRKISISNRGDDRVILTCRGAA